MKCHYEILDVPRDADSGEIKSAYRKAALKWHPDKNLNNEENAKEQFQLVQQAYEVLSDSQERAWYDKYREQILRGSSTEFQDNSLDVFQYFTTTCFKGYGDDENGFYTIYCNVFDRIIKEDLEFMDDKEEFCEIPRFGDSRSDYDDVVGPFYSYWMSYSTKKSYVWLDPYNINETRDRKVVKIIESKNKKVRQKAKRERNEEIRNLVGFVRKRDKRVQEHTRLLEARVLENRQKQEEISKLKRLERKKQLNESGEQAEWAKFDNVKSQLEEIERNLTEEFGEVISNSDDDYEDFNDLYCVACNKQFKTTKALENHEASKKHRENVALLKDIMLEEEEEGETEIMINDKVEDDPISEEWDSESSTEKIKKEKRKKKKARNILPIDPNQEDENHDLIQQIQTQPSEDDVDFTSKKSKKKSTRKANKTKVTESTVEDNGKENETNPVAAACNKQKSNEKNKDMTNSEVMDLNHCCVSCKSSFPSKNKLFEHLKKTGHGVYIPNNSKRNGKTK